MVAVVGDPGSGKSALLEQAGALARQELPGLPVVRLQLDRRLSEPGAALAWLAEATQALPPGAVRGEADLAALEQALAAEPPKVFLVDDLHRLVLRAVGGFGAARAVLRVMLATCEEHLWVCAVHRPTWDYLAGVGTSINLDAFRLRLLLDPVPAARLQDWATERAQAAGLALSFAGLVGGAPVGLDARRAEERAAQAWFRLLADASGGNPEVAWGHLRQALVGGAGPSQVEVRFFQAPGGAELEALADLDLFVLTAVVMHGELDGAALSEVLNAPLGQVHEACRRLEGLGVLREEPVDAVAGWRVPAPWWPAVVRTLRQRHFLHLR
ncbi:ATP-binding protein [Myxococcota bacterium]|nr:ATP-binding protein [Myxococcota bacterium]